VSLSKPPRLLLLLAGESLSNLLAVAQRSVLALLGIVIGTAAVIAMLDVGHNAEKESIRQFKSMGTDLIVAQILGAGKSNKKPSTEEIEFIPASSPSLRLVTPVSITDLRLGRGDGLQVSVIGATYALESVAHLSLDKGRFLSAFDQTQTFAVIGATIAKSSKISSVPLQLGNKIRMGYYLFTVIGIMTETAHNPLLPFDINNSVVIPVNSTRRINGNFPESIILASATNDNDPTVAAKALREQLNRLGYGKNVQIQTARQLLEGMQKQARIMSNLLAAIGGISLLVGGVGVMNVMLMNVAERRREIGLRMALGARRSYIRIMFLMEAAMLSSAGGVCGTGLGVLAAYIYARHSEWIFSPSTFALPLGIVISIGVGLFFGAYPAATAARLDPIETLRAE